MRRIYSRIGDRDPRTRVGHAENALESYVALPLNLLREVVSRSLGDVLQLVMSCDGDTIAIRVEIDRSRDTELCIDIYLSTPKTGLVHDPTLP
jgi:hypothetical protein